MKHFGNTSNKGEPSCCFHKEHSLTYEPRNNEVLSTLCSNSEREKRITKSVAAFITKNLFLRFIVENSGSHQELLYKLK